MAEIFIPTNIRKISSSPINYKGDDYLYVIMSLRKEVSEFLLTYSNRSRPLNLYKYLILLYP